MQSYNTRPSAGGMPNMPPNVPQANYGGNPGNPQMPYPGVPAPGPSGPGVVKAADIDYTVKENVSDFEKENDFVNFFRYIQGYHTCTHSSMIGPSDHRIPKSGKFDVLKPECLEKLYAAVAFFYRQGKPLVLCEIATSRFR